MSMAFAFSIPHKKLLIYPNNNNNNLMSLKLNNNNGLSKLQFPIQNPRNLKHSSLSYSSGFGGIRFRNPTFIVRSSMKTGSQSEDVESKGRIIFWSCITLVLAVGNRVLYKLALVPMKDYPFFLAQLNTFGYSFIYLHSTNNLIIIIMPITLFFYKYRYVAIYFSILYIRHHAGIVTHEMLTLPKYRFAVIGMLEALGVVAGMYSAGMFSLTSTDI